jgi:hypothetical protein
MTMPPEQREQQIRERLAKITPDWKYGAGVLKHYVFAGGFVHDGEEYDELRLSAQEIHAIDGHETNAENDMKFVGNSPADIAYLLSTLDSERAKCAAKDAALGRYAHSNTITLEQHPTDTIFNNAPWVARAALSPDCGSTFMQRIREEALEAAAAKCRERFLDGGAKTADECAAALLAMKGVAP